MHSWRNAMRLLGFKDLVEAGLGGDMTTMAEAEEVFQMWKIPDSHCLTAVILRLLLS